MLHARALQRAAEILGGIDQLRAYLKVSTLELQTWMQGRAKPPDAVFLRIVDVLAAEQSRGAQRP